MSEKSPMLRLTRAGVGGHTLGRPAFIEGSVFRTAPPYSYTLAIQANNPRRVFRINGGAFNYSGILHNSQHFFRNTILALNNCSDSVCIGNLIDLPGRHRHSSQFAFSRRLIFDDERALKVDQTDCAALLAVDGNESKMRTRFLPVAR